MVKNNFPSDLVKLCKIEHMRQEDIGNLIGIKRASVNRRAIGNVIAKGYVEVIEALGYDIEVIYRKRDTNVLYMT